MLSLLLKNSLIPIKWTAPENLKTNRFTIKFNIHMVHWSFGACSAVCMHETIQYRGDPKPRMNDVKY